MYTIEQFINHNVYFCQSTLMSILTSPEAQDQLSVMTDCDLKSLILQATELSYPMQDYEEAARSIGYYEKDDGWVSDSMTPAYLSSAEEVCETQCIEPYQWEVYEYWAVSDVLAHRLQTEGEHVDRDLAGMNVWARTTTGQAISMDGVIQKIFRQLTCARAGG